MGTATGIEWTDHTFNPWHGCTRVSAGCQHCYAETLSIRIGHKVWGAKAPRRRWAHDSKHWQEPLKWERAAAAGKPGPRTGLACHLVFCASMADVFEDRDDHEPDRQRLFELIDETPHLTWQLLTKRPENVARMVPSSWVEPVTVVTAGPTVHHRTAWPDNVWAGCTVEDPERARERLPHLCALPAPVRFVSGEPLLGPVDLWDHLTPYAHTLAMAGVPGETMPAHFVDWVIVGGESGGGHRAMDLDHARSLRTQCETAEVPMFFKQVGGQHPKSGGVLLDGELIQQFPEAADRTPDGRLL